MKIHIKIVVLFLSLFILSACEKRESAKKKEENNLALIVEAGGKLEQLVAEQAKNELLLKVASYGGAANRVYYFNFSSDERIQFGNALAAFSEKNQNEKIVSVAGDSLGETGGSHNVSRHAGYWVITEKINPFPK
jgi:hypothetical protein